MLKLNTVVLKKLLFFIIPLVLSPLLFFGKELRCVFGILVVSLFWLSDVIPLGIASLLPLFLLPILDISDAKLVSQCYFKDNVVLFLASLIMAMAVEETQLHRRIALTLLNIVGSGKLRVLAGIMITTAFISFFVSDTAATTLMLPIAIAILTSLHGVEDETLESSCNSSVLDQPDSMSDSCNSGRTLEKDTRKCGGFDLKEIPAADRGFCKAIVLSVTQSSIIGGTAILTGAGTNLVFREQLLDFYPEMEVGYVHWLSFSLPFTPLYLLASGTILTVIFMPRELICKCKERDSKINDNNKKRMKKKIKEAHDDLGRISFGEASVLIILIILLLAWCSRNPGFVAGWGKLLPRDGKFVKDSTVAVGLAVLMFIWPRDPFNDDQWRPILTWSTMKEKFAWQCMFMIGAGFAISEAVKDSGLGDLIACSMSRHFAGVSNFWLQVIVTTTACFITEIASNIAAAGIFVPITLSLAKGFQLNPLYLVLPVTLSCSFAFMFPTATPGNAIVYSTKIVTLREMIMVGFLLNISCIWISVLNFNTYSFWLLGLGEVPASNSTNGAELICTEIINY